MPAINALIKRCRLNWFSANDNNILVRVASSFFYELKQRQGCPFVSLISWIILWYQNVFISWYNDMCFTFLNHMSCFKTENRWPSFERVDRWTIRRDKRDERSKFEGRLNIKLLFCFIFKTYMNEKKKKRREWPNLTCNTWHFPRKVIDIKVTKKGWDSVFVYHMWHS